MADDMDKNSSRAASTAKGSKTSRAVNRTRASMVRRADSLDRPANSRRVTLTPARRILLRTSRMSGDRQRRAS